MLSFAYSLPYHSGFFCISYLCSSVSFLYLLIAPTIAILIYSTRSGFLSICMVMLPSTFTTTDATLHIVSASYAHAPSLP